jgi:hypothetical protein
MANKTKDNLESEVDALFKLPLTQFTEARNELAARLKKAGRPGDATLVKTLAKPPISAWAVNQLYWRHRAAFDRLIATGQQFRRAQKSRNAGKIADVRDSLEARRESLSELSELATALLQEAGNNPTLDTVRRITTTLEALSAYASLSDGPSPGRLTQDIDPPGFDSLAALIGGAGGQVLRLVTPPPKVGSAAARTASKPTTSGDTERARRLAETRQAAIAEGKASLQDAKKALSEARAKAQRSETSRKKAQADARQAETKAKSIEKQFREAEERYQQAKTAAQFAAQRAQSISAEADAAVEAVDDAKRAFERATKDLDSLL